MKPLIKIQTMEKFKKLFKNQEIKNLHSVKGGDDGTVDKSKMKKKDKN